MMGYFYAYLIGTACGDDRRAYVLSGPMTYEQLLDSIDRPHPNWYAVAYQVKQEGERPPEEIRNRAHFVVRARGILELDDACCGACHNKEDDLKELQAWYNESNMPPGQPDKVEPFWWEKTTPDAGAAWAATVAIAKGA